MKPTRTRNMFDLAGINLFGIPAQKSKTISKKNLTYAQAKKKYPKMNPYGDADRDGTTNWLDCRPFDRKRQEGTITILPPPIIEPAPLPAPIVKPIISPITPQGWMGRSPREHGPRERFRAQDDVRGRPNTPNPHSPNARRFREDNKIIFHKENVLSKNMGVKNMGNKNVGAKTMDNKTLGNMNVDTRIGGTMNVDSRFSAPQPRRRPF
jgi:hypothetical protein